MANRSDGARSILTVWLAPLWGALGDVQAHDLNRGIQSELMTYGVEVLHGSHELQILVHDLRRLLVGRSRQQVSIVLMVDSLHLLLFVGCVSSHRRRPFWVHRKALALLHEVGLQLLQVLKLLLQLIFDGVVWVAWHRGLHLLRLLLESDCLWSLLLLSCSFVLYL